MKSKFCGNKLSSVGIIAFLLLFIVACGSGGGSGGNAAPAFSQADLTGTWALHALNTGTSSSGEWAYATFMIDSSGNVTGNSCNDSNSYTTCPSSVTKEIWTIDGSGVITVSIGGTSFNLIMTMTSNKNFIAGAGGASDGSQAAIFILQKEVTGTTYSSDDLQNVAFVYHQLTASGTVGTPLNTWEYGVGNTGSGTTPDINILSRTSPYFGTKIPKVSFFGTLAEGADGTITITSGKGGLDSFNGFLSDDKNTIVGTYTDANGNYNLMIIQVITAPYTTGYLPYGTYKFNSLAESSVPNDVAGPGGVGTFSLYATMTTDGIGDITFSNVASNWSSSITAWSSSSTPYIDVNGNIYDYSFNDSDLNGQISSDGKFAVLTDTVSDSSGNPYYSLTVVTQ